MSDLTSKSRFQQNEARADSSVIFAPATSEVSSVQHHLFYQGVWYLVNGLLAVAMILSVYSISWEYSTRRYLRGFSDAIVPESASPEEKIDAILDWMARGPARLNGSPGSSIVQKRDPTDTLNYEALLRVCGTATNAFINLVDTAGLGARRLLLLSSNQQAKHVVAEVLIDDRWIVVDPAYRVVLQGLNGEPLTRNELADPTILFEATRSIPHYDPTLTYDNVAHVRVTRLPILGPLLGTLLSRLFPGWDAWPIVTVMLERTSFAAMVLAILLAILFAFLQFCLRVYGERRFGIRHRRIGHQLIWACAAFLRPLN